VPQLLERVLSSTSRFSTSFMGQITAYLGAVTAAVLAFQKLNEPLRSVPPWVRALIISSPVVLAFTLHTIPALLAERRKKRLREISGDLKPAYFSLAPRDDEASFQRADNKHNEVHQWVQKKAGSVLYLTGASGSGKSSVLAAWVLPRLKRDGVRIVTLRGYQDPIAVLQKELRKPGAIWQEPPGEELDTLTLLQDASRQVRPGQILIVLDQFEECLILPDAERIQRLEQLFSALRDRPIANLTFLLVFRSDYMGLIDTLRLPPLVQEENWKEIPAFTERAAQDFMLGSGLKVSDELLQGVLREAAEIEHAIGLIRPVTINLCGLVLGRFASGVPRGFRPGTLIRSFLQEAVTLPAVREVAPRILPQMITPSVTKVPRTIPELAQSTSLDPAVIRGCMLVLGQTDRAIMRPLDPPQQTWEISHDFLVPLLDSIISRRSVSVLRRVRPYFPWLAAAVLFFTFRVASQRAPSVPRFGELGAVHTSDTETFGRIARTVQPFPPPRGGIEPTLKLAEVYGPAGPGITREIEKAGKIIFHAVGSTGNSLNNFAVEDPESARGPRRPMGTVLVAEKMENDFRDNAAKPAPSFLFLLGDIVYMFGESQYYYGQFYLPYVQYPAPILAVPGNHDGLVVPGANSSTLKAFVDNFCGEGFHQTSASHGLGRTAQIQPGVFFTLEAPFVRILALYSNTLDGPGVVSSEGGKFPQLSDAQLRFLEAAFNRIKNEKFQGAVIIVVHHDPYGPGGRGGSKEMLADLDAVSRKTGVWPHAVLSGHAHNYQRYTRHVDGREIPYIVAGSGGYGVMRRMGNNFPTPQQLELDNDNVTLETFDEQDLGFLRVTADSKELRIEYQPISVDFPVDPVTVELGTGQLAPRY
jgi:hypothetical protein